MTIGHLWVLLMAALQRSLARGTAFGGVRWTKRIAQRFGLSLCSQWQGLLCGLHVASQTGQAHGGLDLVRLVLAAQRQATGTVEGTWQSPCYATERLYIM